MKDKINFICKVKWKIGTTNTALIVTANTAGKRNQHCLA